MQLASNYNTYPESQNVEVLELSKQQSYSQTSHHKSWRWNELSVKMMDLSGM